MMKYSSSRRVLEVSRVPVPRAVPSSNTRVMRDFCGSVNSSTDSMMAGDDDVSTDFTSAVVNSSLRRSMSSALSSGVKPIVPQERRSDNLEQLTIHKLRFEMVGLHGREKEVQTLRDCLDQVASSDSIGCTQQGHLILVSGVSGSGKSRLVETLRLPTIQKNGVFGRGKFDLSRRNQPFSGVSRGFTEILDFLLNTDLPGNPLISVRKELETELGSGLPPLTRVVPMLAKVVPTSVALDTATQQTETNDAGTKNQIRFAFLKLVRILTQHVSPIVLVLDDLQFADIDSLELLKVFMTDPKDVYPKLLVVGIYRANEVDETHILHRYLEDFDTRSQEDDFNLSKVEVGDLGLEAVHRIIQDLLATDNDERTISLAQICHSKTHGNPFFLNQFLAMLYETRLLEFNFATLSWVWNDDEVKSHARATENVSHLLKEKMKTLPPVQTEILTVASCLGATFNQRDLELILRGSYNCTGDQDFDNVFNEGLVRLKDESFLVEVVEGLGRASPKLTWSHDSMQEAATELLSETDRLLLYRRSGELLMTTTMDDEEDGSKLFVAVELLNKSNLDEMDEAARVRLAQLNLTASQRAIKVAAYSSAAKYADEGIKLLPDNAWADHYELSRPLHSIGARAHGLSGNVGIMEEYCNAVIAQEGKPYEDKFDVYTTMIESMTHHERVQDALDLMLGILKQNGCRFPKSTASIGLQTVSNLLRVKLTMKSRDPSKLKPMNDQRKIFFMRLLRSLVTCMYLVNDGRMAMVMFRSLNWTIKYGYCNDSPGAFALVGIVLTGVLNDLEGGALYGEHAIALQSRLGFTPSSKPAETMHNVYVLLFSWTKLQQSLLKPMMQAYEIGLQTGEIGFALFHIQNWLTFKFLTGSQLDTLNENFGTYLKQMGDLKLDVSFKICSIFRQTILNLLGKNNPDDPMQLSGDSLSKDDLRARQQEPLMKTVVLYNQGLLRTFFGDHVRQADILLSLGHDYLGKAIMASPLLPQDACWNGVSCFAAARSTGKKKYAKLANICRRKIKLWLERGNPNVKHFDSLLDAESMAYRGKPYLSVKHYEMAILYAARGGLVQDAAIISERLGEFQLQVMKDTEEGNYRIRKASKYWQSWGARAKVADLKKKYPDVFQSTSEMPATEIFLGASHKSSSLTS
ncbi:Transcriptional regulator [Seminavis robusta]|uniref:Transcriptional regulator n=1 Tax=Seminavis robusta TaxID=568900 RepID=A0A9N8H5E1_9STRA|nr:Transcriptional regulator [Seminavis robusta]|eukprot:Sro84_g044650.1 Transcriptional regulator (1146) ;mRNA; r:15389-18919